MKRKRSKVGRYDPKLMKALRAEMTKHPNPVFGKMLREDGLGDGDVMDFAFRLACAYFSGELLEPCRQAALAELERLTRQTLLKTAALFGMTAIFDKDGGAVLKSAWSDDDPDVQTAAVQALVDTGMSVKKAMASFKTGPQKEAQTTEPIYTRLPEIDEVVH